MDLAFELERLEAGGDRLEVEGRWSGVRGLRFVRPVLVVRDDGRERRLLAVLDHGPWEAADGEPWAAAFPWDRPEPPDPSSAWLVVASDVLVPLAGEGRAASRARDGVEWPPDEGEAGRRGPAPAPAGGSGAREGAAAPRGHGPDPARTLEERLVEHRQAAERAAERAVEMERRLEALRKDALVAVAEARAERDEAVRAKEAAERARDEALHARDDALRQRDRALSERDAARAERDRAARRAGQAAAEHDAALRALAAAHGDPGSAQPAQPAPVLPIEPDASVAGAPLVEEPPSADVPTGMVPAATPRRPSTASGRTRRRELTFRIVRLAVLAAVLVVATVIALLIAGAL